MERVNDPGRHAPSRRLQTCTTLLRALLKLPGGFYALSLLAFSGATDVTFRHRSGVSEWLLLQQQTGVQSAIHGK